MTLLIQSTIILAALICVLAFVAPPVIAAARFVGLAIVERVRGAS